MQCSNIQEIDKDSLQLYRNILGDDYKDIEDEELGFLVNRIKWFCHTIINKKLKDFSKKEGNILSFYLEKNE